jgi:hypothetical protein
VLRLRPRPHGLLAVAAAACLLAAGCTVDLKPAGELTTSSVKLNADARCVPGARSTVWWELRLAGTTAWKVEGQQAVVCRDRKSVNLSRTVAGLRSGTKYQYRLVADPAPAGGFVFRTNPVSFATKAPPAPKPPAPKPPAPKPPAPKPPAPKPSTTVFSPGLVSSADHGRSATAVAELGGDLARVEFDVGAAPSAMRSSVAAFADRGARVVLLAGFHGRMPTEAEARNLAAWAAEFGPGGRFWAGRSDGRLAVRQIEFGNETTYSHQYGDNWSTPSYRERARLYATRFAQAHAAIKSTGRAVGLLAQADDGGSGSSAWVDGMYAAVPGLHKLVDGWTVHPYGPRARWEPKLRRLIAQTAAHGAPATIPIDVTEYGISSGNGVALGDNYGWPVNQTYAQAAAALGDTIAAMRADAAIGRRLRLFMIYSAHDLRPPGSTNREHSFGALQDDLDPKGGYTAKVRELLR